MFATTLNSSLSETDRRLDCESVCKSIQINVLLGNNDEQKERKGNHVSLGDVERCNKFVTRIYSKLATFKMRPNMESLFARGRPTLQSV